jgi:glutamate-1-semialdehyde 2,1-aminomutase
VTPDLCTFGKAMANGFSVACVAGRRELMEVGSIEFEGRERVFLLSTTHGAEMSGLGAFLATMDVLERDRVVEHLWSYGARLKETMARVAATHGLADRFEVGGVACSPYYVTRDADGTVSLPFRTLFSQEMVRNGVLMPWIALSYRHGDAELAATEEALDRSLAVYARALDEGIGAFLEGPVIRPVFRKYN